MPVTKSAKKALRRSIKARQRNQKIKASLKKLIKSASKENLPAVISALDKAAKAHVISRARANRLKSRLTRTVKETKEIEGNELPKAAGK